MPLPRALISLFTGAGGLDIGLEAAGFDTRLCVEVDVSSRETLAKNRPHWRQAEPGDVHQLTPEAILNQAGLQPGEATLLAGGPPCQPFSKASYWAKGDTKRLKDHRSRTLHAYLHLVEYAQPRVILLENVKGLAYRGKDEGLQLLKTEIKEINNRQGTAYEPHVVHVNAAEYGVPQLRERVFIIAERSGAKFQTPPITHGPRSASGEPFLTAWDAIGDLDEKEWPDELNVRGFWGPLLSSIPEGNNYLWHTRKGGGLPLFSWRSRYWSFLLKLAKNRPAWTIQAHPGPAIGPFHWRNRLLSKRELCRLQTFPDSYHIGGSYRDVYRQVGNAVPPALGELLGWQIRRQLLGERVRPQVTLIPTRRGTYPRAERRRPVHSSYLNLRGKHRDHPGVGKGPGARRRIRAEASAAAARTS